MEESSSSSSMPIIQEIMTEQKEEHSDLPITNTKLKKNTIGNESDCVSLNNYQKKQILLHLKEKGCTKKEFESAISNYRTKKSLICDHLNTAIKQAEDYVHEECTSFSFSCITQWLELMKESKVNEHCYYEAAAVINSIANNEPQPSVNELEGINLKELYEWMGKSLLGLPQQQLSDASAQFLSNELELLIDEANNAEGEYQIKLLKNTLKKNVAKRAFNFVDQPNKCSLDPFMLSEEIGSENKTNT